MVHTGGVTYERSQRRTRGEGGLHGWIQTASELRQSYDRLLAAHDLIAPLCLVLFDTDAPRLGEDGRRMAATLRPADCLGAWPGGRLVLLLPDTPVVGARRVIERLGGLLGRDARRWRYGLTQVGAQDTLSGVLDGLEAEHAMPTLRPAQLVPGAIHAQVDWDDLCGLVSWLGRCARSGQLMLSDVDGRRGLLELRGGRVVAAEAADGRLGREGALAALDLDLGRLQWLPAARGDEPPSQARLDADPLELLLEVSRRRDEALAPTQRLTAMPA